MLNDSFEVTWMLTPEQNLYHASKILSGFCEMADAGQLSLRLATLEAFREDQGGPMYLDIRSRATGAVRRVLLDLHDSGERFYPGGLKYADVYFKRSYYPPLVSQLAPEARSKVVPLGLNYACLSRRARGKHVSAALVTFGRNVLRSPLHRVRKLSSDLKLLRGLPPPDSFEQDPLAPRHPSILFQTRVWAPEPTTEDLAAVNSERVALVRALRGAFGSRFRGGVIADPFSRQFCPDVIAEAGTRRAQYAELMRASMIGIYTRGLHRSMAFKLAEYLAAGICIVSEPFVHQLPVPLEPGVHYLPFSTHDECVRQCGRLLERPEEAARMRHANIRYYREWVEPTAHVRDLLSRTFAEPA